MSIGASGSGFQNEMFQCISPGASYALTAGAASVQGIEEYNSKSDARAGAETELQTLSGLPFAEFTPLGSVIFETRNSYTNAVKGRVVSTDTGAPYEDKRATYFRPDTL